MRAFCAERDCNNTNVCVWCGYCRHHARHDHPSGFQQSAMQIRWRQRNGNAPSPSGFKLAEMTASLGEPTLIPAHKVQGYAWQGMLSIPAEWQWIATVTGFGRWPTTQIESFHTAEPSRAAAIARLRELAEDDYYSATCGD